MRHVQKACTRSRSHQHLAELPRRSVLPFSAGPPDRVRPVRPRSRGRTAGKTSEDLTAQPPELQLRGSGAGFDLRPPGYEHSAAGFNMAQHLMRLCTTVWPIRPGCPATRPRACAVRAHIAEGVSGLHDQPEHNHGPVTTCPTGRSGDHAARFAARRARTGQDQGGRWLGQRWAPLGSQGHAALRRSGQLCTAIRRISERNGDDQCGGC